MKPQRCENCIEMKIVYASEFVPVMIKCRVDGQVKSAGSFCTIKK